MTDERNGQTGRLSRTDKKRGYMAKPRYGLPEEILNYKHAVAIERLAVAGDFAALFQFANHVPV